jgi:hypothetical protein
MVAFDAILESSHAFWRASWTAPKNSDDRPELLSNALPRSRVMGEPGGYGARGGGKERSAATEPEAEMKGTRWLRSQRWQWGMLVAAEPK